MTCFWGSAAKKAILLASAPLEAAVEEVEVVVLVADTAVAHPADPAPSVAVSVAISSKL